MTRKRRIQTQETNEEYQLDSDDQENTIVNVETEVQSEGIDIIEDDQVVRRRGKTLLGDIWALPPGHRVVVKRNSLNQPIGEEAGLLGQFLGTLARNGKVCSLSHTSWNLLKKVSKENILSIIKAKFYYNSKLNDWILRSLNNKWSQYKSYLKSIYFRENARPDELIKNVPEGVIEDQWISLVNYWVSSKAQAASERNRRARALVKFAHTSGTKSFARRAHEMKMKNKKQEEPGRAKVYLETHKRKDGTYVDEEIARTIEKCIGEQSDSANNIEGRVGWEGDVLSQVLGPDTNGNVRGVGLLPTSKKVFAPSGRLQGIEMTTMDENMLLVQVRQLNEKLVDMQKKIEDLNSIVEQMKGEINYMKYGASAQTPQGGFLDLLLTGDAGGSIPNF